jgi:hypothetical protein
MEVGHDNEDHSFSFQNTHILPQVFVVSCFFRVCLDWVEDLGKYFFLGSVYSKKQPHQTDWTTPIFVCSVVSPLDDDRYGAEADEIWSIDQPLLIQLEEDGVELPILDVGIAHGEKARGGAY